MSGSHVVLSSGCCVRCWQHRDPSKGRQSCVRGVGIYSLLNKMGVSCAGKQALGFLPEPLISVHSLGALAERTNAQNMRVLYDLAQEGAFGPGVDVTPASGQEEAASQEEASSADSTIAHSAASVEGVPKLSAGGDIEGSTPKMQSYPVEQISDRDVGPSGSTAADATSANSTSSMEPVSQGQGLTELHTGDHSREIEQDSISPHRRSRLGNFLGRLRRRKQPAPAPVQASQSMQSAQSLDQSSPDTQQHTPGAGGEQSETAAACGDTPRQLEESSAREAQSGERSSSERFGPAQHAASLVSSGSQESKESSSSMKAAKDAQGEHSLTVSTDEGAELPDVRLDWSVMNESMMHSLHNFVTTLTTALIAQVSIPAASVHVTHTLYTHHAAHTPA